LQAAKPANTAVELADKAHPACGVIEEVNLEQRDRLADELEGTSGRSSAYLDTPSVPACVV
jgi:hypothetical protein